MLSDQPAIKEVAKVFIVGLALRSYVTERDGQQLRTCFGHELSRFINRAITRPPTNNTYLLGLMSQDGAKDDEMRSMQQSVQQPGDPVKKSGQFPANAKSTASSYK